MKKGLLVNGNCLDSRFIHHVIFWMKDNLTKEERKIFEQGLEHLSTIETIAEIQIGKPAATRRSVVDSTYSYSLIITFVSQENHDIYQKHPTHLKFIRDCEKFWERVVVYDSISI